MLRFKNVSELPARVEPDRIRDSIVQLFYKSSIPFDPIIGYVWSILVESGFEYNGPFMDAKPVQGENSQFVVRSNRHIFIKENIKIQLEPNESISFNCQFGYIGWKNYFAVIQKVISTLFEQQVVDSISRVGIRYISEFPGVNIIDKIHFSYDSEFVGSLNTAAFKFDWNDDPYRIILNIGVKLPISGIMETAAKESFTSFLDIDVIHASESSDLAQIFDRIQGIHDKEKFVFFNLLKPDFLESLNPIYQ